MKTIFITFPFGIAARNMICARVVEKLRERDFRVVIISPQKSHKMLREIYPDERVVLEPYPKYEEFFKGGINKEAGLLERILMGLINSSLSTGATTYRRYEQWLKKRYFTYFRRLFFQSIFSGHYGWSEYFRKLDEKFFPDTWFNELFERYKPDAVFSPHVQLDSHFIKHAKSKNVLSFGQILSVDNLTTKGNIRTKSDYLFVWNDIMKKEAMEYNLYKAEKVVPVGIPQYDIYYNKSVIMPRKEFFEKAGLDTEKELLFYASEATDTLDDAETVQFLAESLEKGRFIRPINILVRPHPRDWRTDNFECLRGLKNVVLDDPRANTDIFIDRWYPSMDSVYWLMNCIYHSSLVIMMGSTIGLDSIGFDKPVISLGFDMKPKPYYLSVRRYYDYFSHQRLWFDENSFRIATNPENLVVEINRYLEHPEYERAERKKLINKLFYKFDGHVGDRIVENIISNI